MAFSFGGLTRGGGSSYSGSGASPASAPAAAPTTANAQAQSQSLAKQQLGISGSNPVQFVGSPTYLQGPIGLGGFVSPVLRVPRHVSLINKVLGV